MSPDLYPAWPTPAIAGASTAAAPAYGRSFAFDFEAGDFILDGAGRVVGTDGPTSWAIWCVKAILTERFGSLVYSRRYGSEITMAMGLPDQAMAESEIRRSITEALMADPRTREVRDFTLIWDGDALTVSFTAVPRVGSPQTLEVRLTA